MARRKVVTWFDVDQATETSRMFDQEANNARVRLADNPDRPRIPYIAWVNLAVLIVTLAAMAVLVAMRW